jgi:membrane protease YdiL (CAAX protease family)
MAESTFTRLLASSRSAAAERPLTAYFGLAFGIPWILGGAAVAPAFLRGAPLESGAVAWIFLVMLLGPSCAGIALTCLIDGRRGLRELRGRVLCTRGGALWFGVALVLFPLLIAFVLGALAFAVAPRFAPGLAPLGLVIGLLAGLFEEIGWTGFALPRLQRRFGALRAALFLGVLWGLWHLVADLLGSAAQLGTYWLPHFIAFCVAMTATRVLMVWVYNQSESVLLVQLMHGSSTGFLITLGPAGLSAADETLWFSLYALVVSAVAAGVVAATGSRLRND